MVSRRQSAAAYLAHGNRLRIRRGQHRLRKDRGKMLDLQKGGGACRNTGASISTATASGGATEWSLRREFMPLMEPNTVAASLWDARALRIAKWLQRRAAIL